MKSRLLPLALVGWLLFSGCSHIGPQTITRDRFDYTSSVGESWKQQTLLNIVKLRYLDLPVFLDVGQIVAGYSMETSVGAGGSFPQTTSFGGNTATVTGSARYTDRPTITYTPLTGDKFIRSLIEPIPPLSLFHLIQAGYAADVALGLSVESFNGLRNQAQSLGGLRTADSEFIQAVKLLRALQLSGSFGIRVEKGSNGSPSSIFFFRSEQIDAETQNQISEIKTLLKLDSESKGLRLVYSPVRGQTGELAVQTRSVLQILQALAAFVDVPERDKKEQRAWPSLETPSEQWPIRVKYSQSKPAISYSAVAYRGAWFWIDDTDLKSKRAFGVIMFLFTLAESNNGSTLPLLTIPTN